MDGILLFCDYPITAHHSVRLLDMLQSDTSAVLSICYELRLASSQDLKSLTVTCDTGVLRKLKFQGLNWFS